jgi:hypothetical protein
MISICIVTIGRNSDKFLEIFLESLQAKTSLVDEILITANDESPSYYQESNIGSISIKKIGPRYDFDKVNKLSGFPKMSATHALGLHNVINQTKNDYILLSDFDIFFHTDAIAFMKNLMDSHELDIAGCSYGVINQHIQGYFPCQIFSLIKKSSLPGPDFLEGKIVVQGQSFDGCYLINAELSQELKNQYPCPYAAVDTSHLLYQCAKQLAWRWLAIGTDDIHNYNAKYYKSNVPNIKLKIQKKLIYHQGGGVIYWPESEIAFAKEYKRHSEN